MESSSAPDSQSNNTSSAFIAMSEDPLSLQLQRPFPHARRTDTSIAAAAAAAAMGPAPTTTMMTAPMVDTTTLHQAMISDPYATTTTYAAAPIIDATKFGRTSSARQRSLTRIEGMDQLEKPMMGDEDELTEAEKRMKEEELSFYSASDNDHGDDNIWGLLSGVGGNIYEWYVPYMGFLSSCVVVYVSVEHVGCEGVICILFIFPRVLHFGP
jgi:hypothetical protein